MTKSNNKTSKTFWELLSDEDIDKIQIPIIQRDYAHGRQDRKIREIREKFLDNIIQAIETEDKSLELDFIYGDIENKTFQPLDGQQRLTTLFLLHWFIAFKEDKLKVNHSYFNKFTYETRISSREFCRELVKAEKLGIGKTISEQIIDSPWFFLSWKKDPTIKSMLVMLDNIEEKLKEKDNLNTLWNNLTKNPTITFHQRPLANIGLTDDLYIKMNARGKALTSFENFKADFVSFVSSPENKFKKIENPTDSISHKLDTTWTDLFWKFRSNDARIDEIYFAFINRFLLNEIIVLKNKEKNSFYYTQIGVETNVLFKHLYGENSNDIAIGYYGFNVYSNEKVLHTETTINRLINILDNFHSAFLKKNTEEINSLLNPTWNEDKKFHFIPKYETDDNSKNISTLTQPQRVVFYAVCAYFEENKYDEAKFKQWMRIIWNIVENVNINSIDSMIGAIRLVDELKEHSNSIYDSIVRGNLNIESNFAKDQLDEEIEKVKQIKTKPDFENKIIEAENISFFKGAIRFLFRQNNGEYNWDNFDKYLAKSKKYFGKDGVNVVYKEDSILLRVLISQFSDHNQFQLIKYDNRKETWKSLLLNNGLISVVNSFFDINNIISFNFNSFESTIEDNEIKNVHNYLCKSTILNHVYEGSLFKNHDERISLYPYNTKAGWKIFVLNQTRNNILYDLEQKGVITVHEWQKIYDKQKKTLPFYTAWDIYFTHNEPKKEFRWTFYNEIHLQKENDEWDKIELNKEITLENLRELLSN